MCRSSSGDVCFKNKGNRCDGELCGLWFFYVFLVSLLSLVGGHSVGSYLQVLPILTENILDVFLYYSLALLCFDLVLEFSMVLKF
jgi:hypothetical protein